MEKNGILTETHIHNKEASPCAGQRADDIPQYLWNRGYRGLIVTNHYSEYCLENHIEGHSVHNRAKNFLKGSQRLVTAARKIGMRAFLGAEITLARYRWQDYLVYGDLERGLIDHPQIYTYTQEQLYGLAAKYGWAVYQAHPFRIGCSVGDPAFMDGIEIYNGRNNDPQADKAGREMVAQHNLKTIAGSDFHDFAHKDHIKGGLGGIYLPDHIKTDAQLGRYLKTTQAELFIQKRPKR